MFTFYLHLISQFFFISILLTSASDKLCMLKITIIFRKVRAFIMLLFVVEIIIMILAIILGLRTAGALGCGIFAIVAQLIMILVSIASRFSTCHCSFNHFIYRYRWWYFTSYGGIDYLVFLASKIIERFPKSIILSHQ